MSLCLTYAEQTWITKSKDQFLNMHSTYDIIFVHYVIINMQNVMITCQVKQNVNHNNSELCNLLHLRDCKKVALLSSTKLKLQI